jgi:RNA polymerase sigma-70 factor (ECF subfamily)
MVKTATTPTYTIEDTDELLLSQYAQTGDRKVFEILMRRYEREIFSYLRRYIGNPELAEDAFQGTFLQVHLKCDQFDSTRRFRPWLYAIATNQAIDAQRRSKRRKMVSLDTSASNDGDNRPGSWADKLVADVSDPADVAGNREDGRWVNDAVSGLGDSLQRVVQLVYFQGLKYREAADILGIPVGTVKSRVHAAIQRLAINWQESHEQQASN